MDNFVENGTEENRLRVATDGFASFNCLVHILTVIHRRTYHNIEWGFAVISTNPIEQLWEWIKEKIRSIYRFFPPEKCQEFIIEGLWRWKKGISAADHLEELLGTNFD